MTLKPKLWIGLSTVYIVHGLITWYVKTGFREIVPTVHAATGTHGTYNTTFPLTENPISEGGNWINGAAVGVDWTNVRTTPGLAFGTMAGNLGAPQQYADSTAVLAGSWGPNQTVQATIHTKNQPNSGSIFEEVELRLRTTITAHSITGYEINFSCSATNLYTQVVRWNGPLASWTQLDGRTYHAHDGDVVKASMIGSTITVWINNVQIYQVNDSTFAGGSPGIGFFLQGASGLNGDFGFSNFMATDGSTTIPNPPTGLTTTAH